MQSFRNIIAIWSGAIVDIPANWQLCDGTNGTPDLVREMVRGSHGSYAIGETGGNASHIHGFTSDGHTHDHTGSTTLGFGETMNRFPNSNTDSGYTDETENVPPYYALAFIMRLS